MPTRTRIAKASGCYDTGAVQLPYGDFPAVVLPQDVGMTVAVEIPGCDHLPTRAGVADKAAADDGRPVEFPYGDLTVIVLPQDVRLAVTVEIACHHDPDSPCKPAIVTCPETQNTRAGRLNPTLDPISLCSSPYPSSAHRPCARNFSQNRPLSCCQLPAMQVERPQAVARAEKDRAKISEAGDEDDRWPRGEIEVK